MAKTFQDTITVKFIGEGKGLEKTIKDLDKATKALIDTQLKMEKAGEKVKKVKFKLTEAGRKLYLELKSKGVKSFKDLNIAVSTSTRALRGSATAMRMVRTEMTATTASTVRLNKGILGTQHSTRLLDGAFSVLRSKLLLASFAMLIFIRPLTKMIGLAGHAEETLNKFNVVFGKFNFAMKKWASEFGNSIGYAESTLQGFASTFQDTFVPMGFARDESARFSKSLTELAIDVASFSDKMDADVVRDFQSAIVGNHETVRKYGIIIQEASIKQKAYDMGLADTGEELTNTQKVMARFQMIVEGSTDAIGDKVKTMGEYTNTVKAYREELKTTGEELGQALMPFATQVLKMASHFADSTLIKGYVAGLMMVGGAYVIATGAIKRYIASLVASKVAMRGTWIGIAIMAFAELASAISRTSLKQKELNASMEDMGILTLIELSEKRIQLEGQLANIQSNNVKIEVKGKMQLLKAYQEQVDAIAEAVTLIEDEITRRKGAVGIVDDSATALLALEEAYKKTTTGKIDALESQIQLIESTTKSIALTKQQATGLASLISQLAKLRKAYSDSNLTDAQKRAEKALESTNIAKAISLKATIAQLKVDRDASVNKKIYTEAIKTQTDALELLLNPVEKLTDIERAVGSALSKTVVSQIEELEKVQTALHGAINKVFKKQAKMTKGELKAHNEALADVKNQIHLLKNPIDTVVDSYEEWVEVQEKQAKSDEDIAGWTQILIDKDYALADALGLVKKTQAELNAEKAIASTDLSKEKEIRDTLTILELEQSSIDTLIAQGDAVKSNIAQLEKRKALLQVQMLVPDADKTAVTAKAQEIEATLELLRAERREFAWQEKHMEQLKSKVRLWEAEKEAITTGIGFGDEAGKEIEILGLGDEARLGEITKLITEYKNSIAELGLTKEQATKKLLLPESIREVSKELAEHTEFVQAGKAEYESIGLQIEKYTESLLKLGLTEEQIARNAVLIEAIKLQKEALEELGETQKAVWSEGIEIALSQFREASGAYSSFVRGVVDADINALKARDDYQRASSENRATMEEDIRRKNSSALRRSAILEKASAVASATMNTYEAVTEAYATVPHPFKIPASVIIAGLGMAQVASIIGTPLAYRQGGLIGGRSHEQGGTMIEAERGEFIMSRSAVESIGTSALNSMNQGGGGGITINISAPLVDETVIDTIIPAIQKAQRMNLA